MLLIIIVTYCVGIYPKGCRVFRHISPNIEMDESSIKDDRETTISDELTFTEVNVKYYLDLLGAQK